MKLLAVAALAVLCLLAACSSKQENADRPERPPLVVPGPPTGSWILDAPNQPPK
jgi:hypothetical protein